MSLEAVLWVKNLEFDACTLGEFRVLLILAEHANSEGERAFRSKRKIANTLGVDVRSVQRWYQGLIAAGLITAGDQSYVASVPANHRPIVYDLAMLRSERFHQLELPEVLGETELSTGLLGETASVALGETAAVVSENQVLNQPIKSIKGDHSSYPQGSKDTASGGRCPNNRKGHTYAGEHCIRCGLHLDQSYDPISGNITWSKWANA
jgi:hypothetical protein